MLDRTLDYLIRTPAPLQIAIALAIALLFATLNWATLHLAPAAREGATVEASP